MRRLGVDRPTARVVLCARGMPEFRDATDADLLQNAQVIQAAARFESRKSIAAWHRAHPLWGEALRTPRVDHGEAGSAAPNEALPGSGNKGAEGGRGVQTVRFSLTDAAILRDKSIFDAVKACRSGVLAPAVALRDSLLACAAFGAEVAQRAACYALIDSGELQSLRQMKPLLRGAGESGTREFDYVRRVVMGGESTASICVGRSAALYERSALPLRALDVAAAACRPRKEQELERQQRTRHVPPRTVSSGPNFGEAGERPRAGLARLADVKQSLDAGPPARQQSAAKSGQTPVADSPGIA